MSRAGALATTAAVFLNPFPGFVSAGGGGGGNCTESLTPDFTLLGSGRCVDSADLTPLSYACTQAGCPAIDDLASCSLVCTTDSGCTGFEMRDAGDGSGVNCFVFVAKTPKFGSASLPWPWVQYNGTQPNNARIVVSTSRHPSEEQMKNGVSKGNDHSCCYKKNYPRPNPDGNPVPQPPKMTPLQKQIYAEKNAIAAAASAEVMPALVKVIDYCIDHAVAADGVSNANLFNATNCPGMADLTEGGASTTPSAAQILERWSKEVLNAEYGHGYQVMAPVMNMTEVFNPLYNWILNLCVCGLQLGV